MPPEFLPGVVCEHRPTNYWWWRDGALIIAAAATVAWFGLPRPELVSAPSVETLDGEIDRVVSA